MQEFVQRMAQDLEISERLLGVETVLPKMVAIFETCYKVICMLSET
jgi:hypothetical protein